MPPLFGEAEPLLRFGDASAFRRSRTASSLRRCLRFSAKPNRFFAFRRSRTASSLRLRRSRCLRFAGDANETQLRFGFGGADAYASRAMQTKLNFASASAEPMPTLLRFFASASAEPMPMPSLRFGEAYASRAMQTKLNFASAKPPLLRFFASASAEPMPMRRKGDANETQLRFGFGGADAYASPLLRFGFGGADADAFASLRRSLRFSASSLRLRRSRCQCEGRAMQTFILCIACFGFGGANAKEGRCKLLFFASHASASAEPMPSLRFGEGFTSLRRSRCASALRMKANGRALEEHDPELFEEYCDYHRTRETVYNISCLKNTATIIVLARPCII
jgi:hypothetical protein